MRLHSSPASPYVRKVLVFAHETGLFSRLDQTGRVMTPVAPDTDLDADNPLGKIPALVTDDGMALFDSRVICEYLDTLHDGPALFPAAGPARWVALRRQALCDGILDAAVGGRYEAVLRPQALRWSDWIEGQKRKVGLALDALEREAGDLGEGIDIGTICVGCALGYLDFRYAHEPWRGEHPALAAWFETFGARESMRATTPANPG